MIYIIDILLLRKVLSINIFIFILYLFDELIILSRVLLLFNIYIEDIIKNNAKIRTNPLS